MAEFDLIQRLKETICAHSSPNHRRPVVGIGDDGAVLELPQNRQLVVTTDTLVEGVHFHAGISARDLGHKALAVNLSDLASMGAEPAWFFLALTLAEMNSDWLDEFARGMAELAAISGIQLAGGDTTSGPLSITITALGLVENDQALRRTGASTGDLVLVSGSLGGAALAVQTIAQGRAPDALSQAALDRPMPRVDLGCRLRGLASSCVDVSDGLLADLGHILEASGKGADIELECLPRPASLDRLAEADRLPLQIAGGDDYELCFTVSPQRHHELKTIESETGIPLSVIGRISAAPGLRCRTADGKLYHPPSRGFEHFSSSRAGEK
jgi:thiamine-monophosphate kinase